MKAVTHLGKSAFTHDGVNAHQLKAKKNSSIVVTYYNLSHCSDALTLLFNPISRVFFFFLQCCRPQSITQWISHNGIALFIFAFPYKMLRTAPTPTMVLRLCAVLSAEFNELEISKVQQALENERALTRQYTAKRNCMFLPLTKTITQPCSEKLTDSESALLSVLLRDFCPDATVITHADTI